MIKDLLKCLYSYMVSMEYKGKDFGNRVKQYAVLKVEIAKNMVKKVLVQQKHIFQLVRECKKNTRTKRTKRCNVISSRN